MLVVPTTVELNSHFVKVPSKSECQSVCCEILLTSMRPLSHSVVTFYKVLARSIITFGSEQRLLIMFQYMIFLLK